MATPQRAFFVTTGTFDDRSDMPVADPEYF
jgi:hypothetical protein